MKKIILVFLLALGLANSGTYYPTNFGLYLGGGANLHSNDFALEPNPEFSTLSIPFNESNTSFGFNVGGILNYSLDSMFMLTGRLGYHTLNQSLSNEFGWNRRGNPDFDTLSNYSLDNSLAYLEFTPGVQIFNLIPVDNLYLLGGFELGFALSNNSEYSYEGQSVANNENFPPENLPSGQIDNSDFDANTRMAIAFGAGYMFKLADDWLLSPELSFRFPINQVSSSDRFDSWSVPQVRLGVNITFGFFDEKEEIPEESFLNASIDGPYTYDSKANRVDVNRLKVEEVKYSELFPLLPYVFFPENKSVPREDSQNLATETGAFELERLEPDALSINRNTIDIIGSRMSKSDAIIEIVGTTDGDEELVVAKERAEFAKDYLVVNYGIDPERLKIKSQELPNKASSPKVDDGKEENRRIEIKTNDASLLDPITIELNRQTYATPNLIEFVPKIEASDSINSWTMEITQEDRLVKRFAGYGSLKALQWAVLPNDLARTKVPIDYTFYVEDVNGQDDQVSGSIPVDYFSTERKETETRSDKEISKFSLVVFDFDSPEISFIDKEILKKNVIPSIQNNSVIQIYGYADRIGNDEYNKKLALRRAESVKNYIEPFAINNTIEVYGIGESIEIYDNNLPAGRQLSRTVQIYVITPTK